eukprot:11344381-Prorocentrum_lima.AAC.1
MDTSTAEKVVKRGSGQGVVLRLCGACAQGVEAGVGVRGAVVSPTRRRIKSRHRRHEWSVVSCVVLVCAVVS